MNFGNKLIISFLSFLALIALLPFAHEYLHFIPAYFLGMSPVIDWSLPVVWYWGGTWWTIIIAHHMPELVMLSIGVALTWTLRTSIHATFWVFPLWFMATWGFLGHMGIIS